MRKIVQVGVFVCLVSAAGFLLYKWKRDEPRRFCLETLERFHGAFNSASGSDWMAYLHAPTSLNGRTLHEQREFLTKALRDEVSLEGLNVLRQQAEFGPLDGIFPKEGKQWAESAGVPAEECVAFRMERNGIRAEVVLHVHGEKQRILRCNNVKQMAQTPAEVAKLK